MRGRSICWLCEPLAPALVLVHPGAEPGDCVVCGDLLDELDRERCDEGADVIVQPEWVARPDAGTA